MSADYSHIEKVVLQQLLDESNEREVGYWHEIGVLKYRLEKAEKERDEARELAESLKPGAMELDGLRSELDMAKQRVAELEGILHLIIRERNQETFDNGPVFEPVREVS